MSSMYQVEWVQKLLVQIRDCLKQNSDLLGVDASKPQRILDYACGNGPVSIVSTTISRPRYLQIIP